MKILFYFISITYGIIQTLIGAVFYLYNIRKKHTILHGKLLKEWNFNGSVSFRLFIFVNKYQKDYQLLRHEYDHIMQSLILGTL